MWIKNEERKKYLVPSSWRFTIINWLAIVGSALIITPSLSLTHIWKYQMSCCYDETTNHSKLKYLIIAVNKTGSFACPTRLSFRLYVIWGTVLVGYKWSFLLKTYIIIIYTSKEINWFKHILSVWNCEHSCISMSNSYKY
jgi:hypothetical protein